MPLKPIQVLVLSSVATLVLTLYPVDQSNNPCISLHQYQEWQTVQSYISPNLWVIQFKENCPNAVAAIAVQADSSNVSITLDVAYQNAPFYQGLPLGLDPSSLYTKFTDISTAVVSNGQFQFSLQKTGLACASNFSTQCPSAYAGSSSKQLLCTDWRVPEYGRGWQVAPPCSAFCPCRVAFPLFSSQRCPNSTRPAHVAGRSRAARFPRRLPNRLRGQP